MFPTKGPVCLKIPVTVRKKDLNEWKELYGRNATEPVNSWSDLYRHMHDMARSEHAWTAPDVPTEYREAQRYIMTHRHPRQRTLEHFIAANGPSKIVHANALRVKKQLETDSKMDFAFAASRTNLDNYRRAVRLVSNGSPQEVFTWLMGRDVHFIGPKTPFSIVHLCALSNRVDTLKYICDTIQGSAMRDDGKLPNERNPMAVPLQEDEPSPVSFTSASRVDRTPSPSPEITLGAILSLMNAVDGDGDGQTPLHIATEFENLPMIDFLLSKGADPFYEHSATVQGHHILTDSYSKPIMYAIRCDAMLYAKDSRHRRPQDNLSPPQTTSFFAAHMMEHVLLSCGHHSSCENDNASPSVTYADMPPRIDNIMEYYVQVGYIGFDIGPHLRRFLELLCQYPESCNWTRVTRATLLACLEWAASMRQRSKFAEDAVQDVLRTAPPESFTVEHLDLISSLRLYTPALCESMITAYLHMQESVPCDWDMGKLWLAFAEVPQYCSSAEAFWDVLRSRRCMQALMTGSPSETPPALETALSILVTAKQSRFIDLLLLHTSAHDSQAMMAMPASLHVIWSCVENVLSSAITGFLREGGGGAQRDRYDSTTCATLLFYGTKGKESPDVYRRFDSSTVQIHMTMCQTFTHARTLIYNALADIFSESNLIEIVHSYWFEGVCSNTGLPI